ncbi:acyl-CoA Delta-9 desaturase-like [Diorhabda sublineata]|uniref:acyl-CoA Delta-9 desaturase-like n=1 Tax=Diorhabda sublineata TaxID=1163346 RepID=UPI0024E0C6BF|nr:acyl-CoA Delta-9 desaturase-like [Diorhabda sublineata]XP_056637933.1 acyl-CoA Delta-9 desaturase-like [Diorhabda sublineata]
MGTENITDDNFSQNDVPYPKSHLKSENIGTDPNFQRKIVWRNVVFMFMLHLLALYGFFLVITFKVKLPTFVWGVFLAICAGEGITMGAHRCYSHRTFKATLSLRLIIIILQTLAGQNSMYVWVRDHRLHHKFTDTDADPHNATRGFFFSHVGWLLSKKHPLVKEKGKTIDMSDLEADYLVMFQKRWIFVLFPMISVVFPTAVPMYLWNETFRNSFLISFVLRYVVVLNHTWTVNSLAHIYGNKPFDKNILASENSFVSALTGGEGWHNYHHVFPWDYRAAEYGTSFSLTTMFIEFARNIGAAHNLKTAPRYMIERKITTSGDGSHPGYNKMANGNRSN